MSIQTKDPSTNEVVESFKEMTTAEIENAVCTAHDHFDEWRKATYTARADLLRRVAALMRQKKPFCELSELGMQESANKKLIRVSALSNPF